MQTMTYAGIPAYSPAPWQSNPSPAATGSVPQVPAAVSTAPQATHDAMSLGQQVYNQLPGYQTSLGNVGNNIMAETGGKLPQDVIDQISQTAAERGVSGGFPGSPNVNADLLAAIGQNSLSLTNMGQQNLQNFLPTLPGAAVSQSGRFSLSPELSNDNATTRAVYASAPNPSAAQGAALRAAAGGISAGMGYGGGGFTGASGTSPTASLDAVNQILARYSPTVTGGAQDDKWYGPGASNPSADATTAMANPWEDDSYDYGDAGD